MSTPMVRIGAVAHKEFRHLWRDRRLLAIVLALPIMQLLLFSYAISFDVKDIPTVMIDQDRTSMSRHYVSTYTSSGFFDVVGQTSNVNDVDGIFARGEASVAVPRLR